MEQAIFGFGQADNEVISEGAIFPLFVRGLSEKATSFIYLGNYTATKLDPVAWEILSKEVCFFIVYAQSCKPSSNRCLVRKKKVL
jgi:hypothetical protein